jgi:hypothetical protein
LRRARLVPLARGGEIAIATNSKIMKMGHHTPHSPLALLAPHLQASAATQRRGLSLFSFSALRTGATKTGLTCDGGERCDTTPGQGPDGREGGPRQPRSEQQAVGATRTQAPSLPPGCSRKTRAGGGRWKWKRKQRGGGGGETK